MVITNIYIFHNSFAVMVKYVAIRLPRLNDSLMKFEIQ